MPLAPIGDSYDEDHQRSPPGSPPVYTRSISAAKYDRPVHSRHTSASSIGSKLKRSSSSQRSIAGPSRPLSRANVPTPLRINQLEDQDDDDDGSHENSLVLHHSDEEPETSGPRPRSPASPRQLTSGKSTADKAGVILGIHNVFVVLPQFLVTGLSSFIFWWMEPDKSRGLPGAHPQAGPIGNPTAGVDLGLGPGVVGETVERLLRRAEAAVEGGSPDAVGLIFR